MHVYTAFSVIKQVLLGCLRSRAPLSRDRLLIVPRLRLSPCTIASSVFSECRKKCYTLDTGVMAMTFGKTRIAFALAATIFQAVPSVAATLYVSRTGEDSNPGTISLPLRSISKAAQEAQPGSKVIVQGGLYKEVVIINVGGTAELPVTFESAPGEEVVIDGASSPPDTNLVQINASYVNFRGFTVRNSTRGGIAAWGAHHIEIANNKVQGSRKAGIWVGHSEVGQSYANVIAHNEVWNNCLENSSRAAESGWPQGISLRASDRSTVIGNRVYRNYGEGIGTLSTEGSVSWGMMSSTISASTSISTMHLPPSSRRIKSITHMRRTFIATASRRLEL